MFSIVKKWTIFPPWNETAVSAHYPSIDDVFKIQAEIISSDPQSEIFSQEIDDKRYFIKRYFRSKGLASWLGYSRLRVETRNQQWFHKMGISAARVVAYGEESFFLKTIRGVLITQGVDDVSDLNAIARDNPEQFNNTNWRNAIISQLAEIVATLHQNRFCHNDFFWRNILIQQHQPDNKPKIYLIDCPSGKRLFWPFLHHRKLKDLASLDKIAPAYLTRTQRLKFFLEYRQITKLSAKDKAMIYEIVADKERRRVRKANRQR